MVILDPRLDLPALPAQPDEIAWPTADWPVGELPGGVNSARLEELLETAFGLDPDPRLGESHAGIVVYRGRIVAERYGSGSDETTPLVSWSIAKSVIHALVGILVDRGELDPAAPAAVPEWADPTDPRSKITLEHLLTMTDGLDFTETYTIPDDGNDGDGWSHVIDMLFGTGIHDHAAYTAARPLAHPPGTVFNYSSGTSNIVARIVCDLIGRGDDAAAWMDGHLFDPIGMTSATPSFDGAGTFVGSSYVHATARDWARFGLLYLRGGRWDGRQVIPREWVEECRRTRAVDNDGNHYGTHWWTANDHRGAFHASGYEMQRVICVPTSDLVVVRLGKTPQADYPTTRAWLAEIIELFDPVSVL